MASTNKFRSIRPVGSPSVEGAAGIETLAGHTNNPEAHPDYMKKDMVPAVFSGTEHIANKLAHAASLIRRSEVALTKMDYEKTKMVNYVSNSANYMATSGVQRHIITSYVLYQILESLGLTSGATYLRTNQVVGKTTKPPASSEDNYVASYGLYRQLKEQIDLWSGSTGIAATYLSKVDAGTTYATKTELETHTHDVMSLNSVFNVMKFCLTYDNKYVEGKTYYKYNPTTLAMEPVASFLPGTVIPTTEVLFEETGLYLNNLLKNFKDLSKSYTTLTTETLPAERVSTAMTLANLECKQGFGLTEDTAFETDVDYYQFTAAELTDPSDPAGTFTAPSMSLWTGETSGDPSALGLYCKVALEDHASGIKSGGTGTGAKSARSAAIPSEEEALEKGLLYDSEALDELKVKSGYALTADTAKVYGTVYYRYIAETKKMQEVVPTGNPSAAGYYVKVKSCNAAGSSTYDDTEIKAKLGYAFSADVDPVDGTVYYKFSKNKMEVYSPVHPAQEGAYVKVVTSKPEVEKYDDTELRAKSIFVKVTETSRVSGETYYVWNAGTKKMEVYTGANAPAEGWWVQINTGKTAKEVKTVVDSAIRCSYPDASGRVDLNVTKSSMNNIWLFDAIPYKDGVEQSGQVQLSVVVNADDGCYGRVEVADRNTPDTWVPVANFAPVMTPQGVVIPFNYSGVTRAGSQFRLRLMYSGSSTAEYPFKSACFVRSETPAMAYFMPFKNSTSGAVVTVTDVPSK